MGKVEKDQIGGKEFFAIIVLLIGTKAGDMTTTLLYGKAFNAAWMVVIGAFLVMLPGLVILNLVLGKFQQKNLMEIIFLTFGKYVGFLIGFGLFAVVLFATAVDTRSYSDQLITMNFPKTPLFALYGIFLVISFYLAKKGWESIGSIAWMIIPYIIIVMIFLGFLLVAQGEIKRVFPLFGPGIMELANLSFSYTSIYGDAVVLAMVYPFVKSHGVYTKGVIFSLGLTVLGMALLYCLYSLVFDYRSIDKITYPFNEATRFVSLGSSIKNIETLYLTFWLLGIFVKFSIYLYVLSKLFGSLFCIGEFEQTLFPLTTLVLLIGMMPENQIENVFVLRDKMLLYSKYFFLTLPPILWLMVKVKEVMKR